MLLRNEKYEPVVRTIVLISTLTMLAAVSMYAYLGSFPATLLTITAKPCE
ncbi:MAG: hypothetical protein IPJ47_07825 [Anaerolineales bacterium]|nr:hypothetical protein [Anaerolineales bacterium]